MSQAIIVMGVAGSGKTTIGSQLAMELRWHFFDGDDYHSKANREKMASRQPLSDVDRLPWLEELHGLLVSELWEGRSVVLACSALKESYRQKLARDIKNLKFVLLKGDLVLIRARMASRTDHFMHPAMLESQFADLEEPKDAIAVDITQPIENIISQIKREIGNA